MFGQKIRIKLYKSQHSSISEKSSENWSNQYESLNKPVKISIDIVDSRITERNKKANRWMKKNQKIWAGGWSSPDELIPSAPSSPSIRREMGLNSKTAGTFYTCIRRTVAAKEADDGVTCMDGWAGWFISHADGIVI